ncbi:MAG: hypothetical protein ACXW27_08905 [Allosphingosinicella sp.]
MKTMTIEPCFRCKSGTLSVVRYTFGSQHVQCTCGYKGPQETSREAAIRGHNRWVTA